MPTSWFFRVLYDFAAEPGSDEISIKAGDELWAVDEPGTEIEDGWLLVRNTWGHRGFVPLQYVEHIDESTELDQVESSGQSGGEDEDVPTWGSDKKNKKSFQEGSRQAGGEEEEEDVPIWGSDKKKNKKKSFQEDSHAKTVPHVPSYNEMDVSLYDLASNMTFLDHHLVNHEGEGGGEDAQAQSAPADMILKPVDTSKLASKPVDIKSILSSPAETVRGLPPPAPTEKVNLDRTLLSVMSTTKDTPSRDKVAAQMRERSRESCLVNPRFVGAVESGDYESLRQLTAEYFDSVEEGKLREAQVLAELESLNVGAEDSTRAATALVRRVTDLEDLIEAEKARLGVSLRRNKEESVMDKGRYLRTPKKGAYE